MVVSLEGSALLERARQGAPEAMSSLFGRYGVRLHAFIRLRMNRQLRGRMQSQDLLQATMLKAFEHIDQFEGEQTGSFMGWLVGIARNEIRVEVEFQGRQKRQQGRSVALSAEALALLDSVQGETTRLEWSERAERLERALRELSGSHQEIILLRSFEELDYPEIAQRLKKSADACRMLYARAMAALTLEMRRLDGR